MIRRIRRVRAALRAASVFAAGASTILVAASSARAGGFYVPEQGARATGMAGAVVAAPGEVTGIFHNPASIATVGTLGAEAGGLLVLPNFTFFRAPTTDQGTPPQSFSFAPSTNTNRVGAVPLVGVASNLGVENLGVGVALYVPFGAQLSFPSEGSQRDVMTSVALQSIHVTPTVAYRFFNRFSVGAGISYINSSFSLHQKNSALFIQGDPNTYPDPAASQEGDTQLDLTDSLKFGASVGMLYEDPDEHFSVGASLMTPTSLDLRGNVHVTNPSITPVADQQLPAGQRTDNAALSIALPAIGRFGVAVRPSRKILVELDANYQGWSSTKTETIFFQHNYPLFGGLGATTPLMNNIVMERNYHDTVSLRLGAEVAPFESPKLPIKLRAGVLFDQSPIDDRHFDLLTPDSDKLGLSGGAGYQFQLGEKARLGLDLAYEHVIYAERDIGPATVGTDPVAKQVVPGSAGTILNKPAPSFFYGVTRAYIDLIALSVSLKI